MKRVIFGLFSFILLVLWFGFGGQSAFAGDRHGSYSLNPSECWGPYANSPACQAKREARTMKWHRARAEARGGHYEERELLRRRSFSFYGLGGNYAVCNKFEECLAVEGIRAFGQALTALIHGGTIERTAEKLREMSVEVRKIRYAELSHGTLRETYAADKGHSEGDVDLRGPTGDYGLRVTRPRHGHVARGRATKSKDSLPRCPGRVLAEHDIAYAQDYGPSVGLIETGKGTCFYGGR